MKTTTKIKELTVNEFNALVRKSVKNSFLDMIEEFQALSNPKFIHSIKEAREDYQKGRVKNFEDIFNV